MRNSATSGFLALVFAIVGMCGGGSAQAQDLAFGKHRASAAFPCTPERRKRLAGKTKLGSEIFIITLICTQGGHTYTLGVMEYPPELMGAYSVDELLESYRRNVAAKKLVQIKSSRRMTHKGFPAIRYHVLDKRSPVRELITMAVLVDRSMLTLVVFAKSGSLQATKHAGFADSLDIRARK